MKKESQMSKKKKQETEAAGVKVLMKQVKEALLQRGGFDDDLMEQLGEKIAQKVALKTAKLFKAEGGEGDKIAVKAAQKNV